MKKEQKVWAISLIAFGWLAPNPVLSQQDSVRTTQLTEVVITASKFPKSKNETGKVLTVIDAEQLARAAGKDLAQLLNEQVGLVMNGANSNSGKDKSVYLRGAKSEYTLILIDGIPLTDPASISGGAYDLRLLSTDQIERIEIMKGSQSTLYGSDAVAGVINIITKTPGEKQLEGHAGVAYGTYQTLQTSAGLAGYLKRVHYRLGYSRFRTDGISEAKESGPGDFDRDGSVQEAFTANLNIAVNKNLNIRPFARYNSFAGKYDAGAFTDDRVNRYEGTLFSSGGQAVYTRKRGTLQAHYTFDQTDRVFHDTYGRFNYTGKFNHAEFFGDYQLTPGLRVLGGLSRQGYQLLDTTATEVDPAITIYSPYATVSGSWRHIRLEAGARYNHHSRFGSHTTYSVNPVYHYRKQRVFANLSTGFKAPSLYQLYGQYGANPDLKPERSTSVEVGVAGLLKRDAIEWRVVFFNRTLCDVIVYSNFVNVNLDRQEDHGVEVEATVPAGKRLTFRAWYAYVTGRVTTQTAGGDTTFNNLIRRPRHTAGLTVSYRVSEKVHVSSFLQAVGKRTDLYYDAVTISNRTANLKGYFLIDVSAHYRATANFEFFIAGRNLLNTDYQETYGYNTLGFTGTTGLKLNF